MNYNEKVEYLIKTEKLESNDPEIQRRVHDIKQDVVEFECNVFYTFANSIKNLINQIEFLKQQKERYQQNKEKINRKINLYNNQDCIDPIKGDICSLCALRHRIERNKKLYGDRIARDYIIKNN